MNDHKLIKRIDRLEAIVDQATELAYQAYLTFPCESGCELPRSYDLLEECYEVLKKAKGKQP